VIVVVVFSFVVCRRLFSSSSQEKAGWVLSFFVRRLFLTNTAAAPAADARSLPPLSFVLKVRPSWFSPPTSLACATALLLLFFAQVPYFFWSLLLFFWLLLWTAMSLMIDTT